MEFEKVEFIKTESKGGCQRLREWGKLGEVGQRAQIFSHKINKF